MLVLVVVILEIIIGSCFQFGTQVSESFSLIAIFIASIAEIIQIKVSFGKYSGLVLIAFFLRLFLLFADYNNLFPIPGSGSDSEAFYEYSLSNIQASMGRTYLTNYTHFLTGLFIYIGPQRLFAQFLNVIFGMTTILFVYKTLKCLQLSRAKEFMFMMIICFFPQMIIFSGILLRESIIIMSVAISIYLFVLWLLSGKWYLLFFSMAFVLLGTYMHSGMIGLLLMQVVAFSMYRRKTNKLHINVKSIFIITILVLLLVIILSTGSFLTYFGNSLDEEAMFGRLNYKVQAGSIYLTWLHLNSIPQMVLFLPLKVFYFLFSPIPFDWRGLQDIIVFCIDSCVYIYLIYLIYRKSVRKSINRIHINLMMLGFWCAVSLYAFGTVAAGTAMRHRSKFMPLLVIAAAMTTTDKPLTDTSYKLKYF